MIDARILNEKSKFYQDKDISIHVKTSSETFYNGLIISVDEKSLVLEDRKLGQVYVSFSEIVDILPYKDKGVMK